MDNANITYPTPAPMPEETPKPKKGFPLLLVLIIGGVALIAVAVLLFFLLSGSSSGKFAVPEGNSIQWDVNDDDQMAFLFNGETIVKVDDDLTAKMSVSSVRTDYNRRYAVFMTEGEYSDTDDYVYGDLYVVQQEKYVKAADEVKQFVLSPFGSSCFYVTDDELYYAMLSDPSKAVKVDSEVTGITCVSPDGKTVVYVKTVEAKDGEEENEDADEPLYECYVSIEGAKGTKYEKKNAEVIAVSDGGSYVYYSKDDKFYVNDTKLADKEDLSSLLQDYYGFMLAFNRDGSQVLYTATNSDGKTKVYISDHAGEKNVVASGSLGALLTPTGASGFAAIHGFFVYNNTESLAECAVSVFELDDSGDLETNYYYLPNTLGDSEKISTLKNADNVMMLEDGKTVLYIKSGSLRMVNIQQPAAAPIEFSGTTEDIVSFDSTMDGECIYVLDEDGELYYVNNKERLTRIKPDVSNFTVTADGRVYFVNEDDDLYYATPNGESTKIASEVSGDTLIHHEYADVTTIEIDGTLGVLKEGKFNKKFVLN
ncbi:MAG: hypothetical protein IJW62_03595 [Clostridia bacterium]|nr:hypothetical protein [Clostridia bacterium]